MPVELTSLHQDAGHDALTVLDQFLGGHADDDIAAICRDERRALITFDLDFADIRSYPPVDYSGIIVLRLRRQDKLHTLAIVSKLVPTISVEPLEGKLWIVSETSVRISG